MKAIATITEDADLERLLWHVGLDADFPRTRPARCAAAVGFSPKASQFEAVPIRLPEFGPNSQRVANWAKILASPTKKGLAFFAKSL